MISTSRAAIKLSHLYPSVKETLAELDKAGFTMALVTNKPSKFVPDVLAQHGIDKYFVDVLGGDSFPEKKPNPVALNWLLEKHNVKAEEMLMVGDSSNDIKAAKNAGCPRLVWLTATTYGEPISASTPDYVADNIAQLLDVVLVSTKADKKLANPLAKYFINEYTGWAVQKSCAAFLFLD